MSFLGILYLYGNSLSGTLPQNICHNFSGLEELRLETNHFYGNIPSKLHMCTNLQELDLASNSFTGTTPYGIFNISTLTVISLTENYRLTGTLPLSLGYNLPNLERAEMKKTTATQKKSKEVDTATEMPEQQKTRGTKSGAKRKAKKQDLPKHQKNKKTKKNSRKLTYLDRLEFKGKKIQRIAPAVTSWTEEKVKERIKSEVLSGQFGRGKVIPRFEREEERVHERIDENVQAELSDESLKKVTSVLRKMADTVVEFGEVMAEIGNSRTGGGIIKRTFENIAEMINGVSSSQPPQQQGLLDNDDIFNQPSFLDAISALEQAFLQTRKNYAAQPE
nr:Leucine-rich repeat protein kinase family protein [Ipomoea batatas]